MQTRPVRVPEDRGAIDELIEVVAVADGHRPLGEHKYLVLTTGAPAEVVGVVGEDGGEVMAYVALTPTGRGAEWGMELVLHPLRRRDDLVRRLLEAGVDEAVSQGAERLRIWLFQPHFVRHVAALGFLPERELRLLRRSLPLPETPSFPEEIEVRSFRVGSDEEAWLAVNNAAFAWHPENGAWDRTVLTDRQRQPWFDPEGFRMAWRGDVLVGFCWTKVHDNGEGEIYVIATAPEEQGQGLGRALVVEGLSHLAEGGSPSAFLYVEADNRPALGLYRSLGFELDHVDRSFILEPVSRSDGHTSGSGHPSRG